MALRFCRSWFRWGGLGSVDRLGSWDLISLYGPWAQIGGCWPSIGVGLTGSLGWGVHNCPRSTRGRPRKNLYICKGIRISPPHINFLLPPFGFLLRYYAPPPSFTLGLRENFFLPPPQMFASELVGPQATQGPCYCSLVVPSSSIGAPSGSLKIFGPYILYGSSTTAPLLGFAITLPAQNLPPKSFCYKSSFPAVFAHKRVHSPEQGISLHSPTW